MILKILSVAAMPLCLAVLVLAGASIWVAALEPFILPLLFAAFALLVLDTVIDIHRIQAIPGHDEDETCEECEQ